jgi:hypothetical protein
MKLSKCRFSLSKLIKSDISGDLMISLSMGHLKEYESQLELTMGL